MGVQFIIKKIMKKIFKILSVLFFAVTIFPVQPLFAEPADNLHEYTLENGLTVFLLEDSAAPLIRVEFAVKAGFSSQTQNTCGFFKLYTNIFASQLPQLKFDEAGCYADSSRYIVTIPASKLEPVIKQISTAAFSPNLSDDIISAELNAMKKEVKENASSMSTLINSAIDSKVFSDAPWKHDSGVYQPIFNKTTISQARTILKTISEHWYIPQNSALFVSGNINEEEVLKLIENTFGTYYSSDIYNSKKSQPEVNKQRRFVIHNPEFSNELTQVVVQYTKLEDMEQADLAAAILNNNYSFFKYNLLNQPELNIPGDEYINVASAHKRGSSRLIIQSLLQAPENKKLKTNSLAQATKFLNQVKNSISQINPGEFSAYQSQLIFDMNLLSSNSSVFMEKLSSYWAITDYSAFIDDTINYSANSITAQTLLSRKTKLKDETLYRLQTTLQNNDPYIFVIINSADYKANKDAYKNAGFEEITLTNSSWYTQDMYQNAISDNKQTNNQSPSPATTVNEFENDYYKENIAKIKQGRLLNGIPLITKQNPNTSQISLLLSIRGGKLNTASDNGFEEVMVGLLATNIQKAIYEEAQKGKIFGIPNVTYDCNIATSYILLECEKEDFETCCQCISNALIYGDIIPAVADRAVANRQYKKRLENGSATYQLYSAMIKQLYPKSDFAKIFDSEAEILEKTSYQKILESYQSLLDASRYSVIVTGNFDKKLEVTLNTTLAILGNQNGTVHFSSVQTNLPKNKTVNVKVNHTFLTDIPAEKAGPMPAVLIPTTEFLDPVVYAFHSPEKGTKEGAIFDAILLYLEEKLNEEIQKNKRLDNAKAYVTFSKSQMDVATITIQNVPHIKEIDSAFKNIIDELENQLKSSDSENVIQKIKDNWIVNNMNEAYTNSGTALLLQKGFEYFPFEAKPLLYLEEYNFIRNGTVTDYADVLVNFPSKPGLRVYSKDGKK